MKTVLDTSALISLETIELLELALENIEILTTSRVVDELEKMIEFEDRLVERAENVIKYVDEGKVEVVDVSEKKVDRVVSESKSVDKGEASCFLCAKESKVVNLVMDDVAAASSLEGKAMRDGIHQRISAAVVVELMQKEVISEEKARESLDSLIEDRDWRESILEVLAEEHFSDD
ncbi:MAG: hypothetical protein ACLFSM_00570 [Thermoplasmata archaeon]